MSQKPKDSPKDHLKILFFLIQEIQSTVTIQHILTIYKEETNTKNVKNIIS